jgi:hypothetical protein
MSKTTTTARIRSDSKVVQILNNGLGFTQEEFAVRYKIPIGTFLTN